MGSMAVEEWGHRATHLWGLALHRYPVCRPHASSYGSRGDLSPFKGRRGISPYYVSPYPICGCEIGEPHRFFLLRWYGTNMRSKTYWVHPSHTTRNLSVRLCASHGIHHGLKRILDSAVIFIFFAPFSSSSPDPSHTVLHLLSGVNIFPRSKMTEG